MNGLSPFKNQRAGSQPVQDSYFSQWSLSAKIEAGPRSRL